jgi:hypothetical protein
VLIAQEHDGDDERGQRKRDDHHSRDHDVVAVPESARPIAAAGFFGREADSRSHLQGQGLAVRFGLVTRLSSSPDLVFNASPLVGSLAALVFVASAACWPGVSRRATGEVS